MIFEFESIPIILAAIQALTLGIYLLIKSKYIYSRVFFAFILLSYSFHLFGYSVLLNPDNIRKWYAICMLSYPFLFLIGPLHYLYSRSITESHFRLRLDMLIHALPFGIIAGIFYYTLASTGMFVSKMLMNVIGLSFDAVTVFYVFISYRRLNTFEKHYKKDYSNTNIVNLSSFKQILFFYLIICIGYAINSVFRYIGELAIDEIDYIVSLIFSVTLFMMFSKVMQQSKLSTDLSGVRQKPKLQVLDNNEYERIKYKLREEMEKQKLYLNENLRLLDLAERLNISSHLLSHVINEKLNCNFYEFVNNYRIDTAKKLLIETDNKILAVALDSGFTNKASFNRTFQKFVNMPPSEYREKNTVREKLIH